MNLEFDRHGLVAKATAFAAYAHDGQTRKGGALPYILHPMETANIAATMTNDPEVLAAALLHDVAEDCDVTEAELRARFGKRVAALVMLVTEQKTPDAQGSWQRRKLRTVNRLRAAGREQLILTLADKLSNLRSIRRDLQTYGGAVWQRFNQTNPTMQHWFYASVAEGLRPLEDTDAYREYVLLVEEVFARQGRGAASAKDAEL